MTRTSPATEIQPIGAVPLTDAASFKLQRPTDRATDQSRRRSTRTIALTIDGQAVSVPEGTTLLAACREIGVEIPTLCFLRDAASGERRAASASSKLEGARVLVAVVLARGGRRHGRSHQRRARVKHSRKLVLEMLASSVDLSTTPDVARVDRRVRCQARALRPTGAARAGRHARRVDSRTSRAAESRRRRDGRRADEDRQRSVCPRLREVHSLLQVRRGVRPRSPEHVCDRRRRSRVRRAHLDRVRGSAAGVGVRLLRQLHRRVSHRRAHGEDGVRHARRRERGTSPR